MDDPLTLDDALELAYTLLSDAGEAATSGRTEAAAALNNSAQIALALASFIPEHQPDPEPLGFLH